MPDDDWMLAQGTVEFRQAERDHANGRDRSPARRPWWRTDKAHCWHCGEPVTPAATPGVWLHASASSQTHDVKPDLDLLFKLRRGRELRAKA